MLFCIVFCLALILFHRDKLRLRDSHVEAMESKVLFVLLCRLMRVCVHTFVCLSIYIYVNVCKRVSKDLYMYISTYLCPYVVDACKYISQECLVSMYVKVDEGIYGCL